MESVSYSKASVLKSVKLGIVPSALLVLNFFVFGTFAIHLANSGEFQISYLQIIYFLFFPALVALIILLGLYIVLPAPVRDYYLARFPVQAVAVSLCFLYLLINA